MKNKIPKLLIICSTHGDEKIGLEVVKQLKSDGLESFFDVLVANPRANEKNVRYIEKDLNRSYPGEKNSDIYEESLAFKNLEIAKKYQYIIDIHEADEGRDDFIIIPRKKMSNKFPLEFIDLKRVLLWPDPKGPIGSVLENSIELEFGSKNRDRSEMIEKATTIIKNFIILTNKEQPKITYLRKDIYFVYGKLEISNFSGELKALVDFEEYNKGNEKFIPLLAGQYLKSGIICYKMKMQYRTIAGKLK